MQLAASSRNSPRRADHSRSRAPPRRSWPAITGPWVLDSIRAQFGHRMAAEDIADITYIVTRPRHVAVKQMLIRPTEQER